MDCVPVNVHMSDVWQWLGRGWFFHENNDGELVPARIEQRNDEEFWVYDTKGGEYEYYHARTFPHWPACGAVNLQGLAVIIDRQQTRQYRRTYNSRCVLLSIPRKWDAMKRHGYVSGLTPDSAEVVEAVFNPSYVTYSRALERLDSGWVSVALNPYLIVAGSREEQLIYYRGKLLARIVEGQLKGRLD